MDIAQYGMITINMVSSSEEKIMEMSIKDDPKVYRWRQIPKCVGEWKELTTVIIEPPIWVKQNLIHIPRREDLWNWIPNVVQPTPIEQICGKGPKKITVECKDINGKPFTHTYTVDNENEFGYLDKQLPDSIVNFQMRVTDFDYHPKEIILDWIFSYGYSTPNNTFKEYKEGDWISEYYPTLLEEHKIKEKAAYFVIHDKGGVNILAVAWDIWQGKD